MISKRFNFGDFFELYIHHHTKYNILQSSNFLFYGNPKSEKISQSTASKIRKNGIPPRSYLYQDYTEI